jgi:phytoene synthase
MDLDHSRYRSFSQLREHCGRNTGTAAMIMTHVIGYRGPALDYMATLGLAIELTQLLRHTGDHAANGRIYLPLEEMESFGYNEAHLLARDRGESFRSLMQFQAERIRGYYLEAQPGLDLLDQRGRFAAKVAFDLNRQTLRHIENSGFDVFERRPAVPAVQRCWITARSFAGPATRKLWRVMSA